MCPGLGGVHGYSQALAQAINTICEHLSMTNLLLAVNTHRKVKLCECAVNLAPNNLAVMRKDTASRQPFTGASTVGESVLRSGQLHVCGFSLKFKHKLLSLCEGRIVESTLTFRVRQNLPAASRQQQSI
jgi:hypothetical protein